MIFTFILLYMLLYSFTVLLIIFENTPPFIFVITQFTPTDLLLGIVFGIIFTLVGIILYKYCEPWKQSMLFLTGDGLTKGSKAHLALLSAEAAILEEIPTRFLVLYVGLNLGLFPLNNLPCSLACLILISNLIWTNFHLVNKKDRYKKDKYKTLTKSLPHLSVIFISGLVMYWLTLYALTIYPAIIAHFLLDFLMGLYVRHKKKLA